MYINTNTIKDFISSYPRNRLVIITDNKEVENVVFFDLGLLVAQNLTKIDKKIVVFENYKIIENIIYDRKSFNNDFYHYIAIQNVGILFEPELRFDFQKFIENSSQNLTLFMKWNGEIDNKILYFVNKTNNHKLDLKHVSHIIL